MEKAIIQFGKNKGDYTNKKFGRLRVIGFSHREKGISFWHVICDCGQRSIKRSPLLLSGSTTSCGCYAREQSSIRNRKYKKGNDRNHYLYDTWRTIIRRCKNPGNKKYKFYGKRGITVCDGIQNGGPAYLVKIIGDRPSSDYSIDRIDTYKGYWCGKCMECKNRKHALNLRWATQIVQTNNTRRNRFLEFNEKTMSISQWARHLGVKDSLIRNRLDRLGWSIKDALTKPPRKLSS